MMLPSTQYLKPDYGCLIPRWHNVAICSALFSGIFSLILWRVSTSLPESLGKVCPYVCIAALIALVTTVFLKNRFQNHLIQLRNEMNETLSLKGNEHVLVFFSGLGFILNSLARKMTTGRVVGIDPRYALNQNCIAITTAEENARREGVAEKVELYSDELSSLPFTDYRFDVAVMMETETFATKPINTDELIRVMKSGGKLYIRYHPATEFIIATLLLQGFREHSEARLLHFQGMPILWVCLQKQ